MKLTLTYSATLPDSLNVFAVKKLTYIMRFALTMLFVSEADRKKVGISLIKLHRDVAPSYDLTGIDGCDPEPIIESDLELVRLCNPNISFRDHDIPCREWPQWAKNEAQRIANYRRAITLNLLNS